MSTNPFRPGFGATPEVLVGRDGLIGGVIDRLDDTGAGLCRGFVGDRGVGKTVLLNAIERRAADLGWAVVHRQARGRGDLTTDLLEALPDALADAWGGSGQLGSLIAEVTVGVNLGVAKAEAKISRRTQPVRSPAYTLERNLRNVARHAIDNRYGAGLLITVDEAHQASAEDMTVVGSVMQVLGREELPVAWLLAGLPQLTEAFAGSGTFLERLDIVQVGLLTPAQSRAALTRPASTRGVDFAADAVGLLADAAGGYPYFIQLFGYHTWEVARGGSITPTHARKGLVAARAQVERIYTDRWNALPPRQQRYLEAMAQLDGPVVNASAIAASLDQTLQQLSPVRDLLIRDHRIIRSAGRGKLAFTLVGFREWVRDGGDRSRSTNK